MTISCRVTAFVAVFCLALPGFTQDAELKTMSEADVETWERLGSGQISNDGKWYVGSISTVGGESRTVIRSVDGPEKDVIPHASRPAFSEDSQWVAFSIGVSKEEREKLTKAKKRVENTLGFRNLTTGEAKLMPSVASWKFLEGGTWLAAVHYTAPDQKGPGADLELINLTNGQTLVVPTAVQFTEDSDGQMLAVQIETAAGRAGVQLINLYTQEISTLYWGEGNIQGLKWAEENDVLVFLEGTEDEKKEGDWNVVFVAKNVQTEPELLRIDASQLKGFKEGHRVVQHANLDITPNGRKIAFGTKEWEDKDTSKPKPDEMSNVEIWHSRDTVVVPRQRRTASQDRMRPWGAVHELGTDSIRYFANPGYDSTQLREDMNSAIIVDGRMYESSIQKAGLSYADMIHVDLNTGEQTTILSEAIAGSFGLGVGSASTSPDGRYTVHFAGGEWFVFDSKSSKTHLLTGRIEETFANPLNDGTVPEKPAASRPVWTVDSKGVFLMTNHDVYLARPGTRRVTQLTDDADEHLRFRLANLDVSEDGRTITDPIHFSLFHEKTKATGIAKLEDDGTVSALTYDNARLSAFRKSKDTDRVLFQYQTFQQSNDDFVSNMAFSAAKPMTRTNPQQKDFAWGKAELVDFNAIDRDLQGILYYPAGYEEGKSYPMVTYVYSMMSDGFNSYLTPNNKNSYDSQHFIQNGYFVFRPDITYRPRDPGRSAVECIEAGLKAVLSKDVGVDPERIGLTGHSWGGYETAFAATQTDMISAFAAGAPLTELLAMYNSFYWNSGSSNQVIFESSQGRMAVPWWEDIDAYIANSPLFHAGNVTKPILVEAGTVDGAVDWTQAQFLYQTMRRMGKEMVLLVYPDENHGLRIEANQRDYARRLRHFMDVYLKGAEPQEWLESGIAFIDMDEERKKGGAKPTKPKKADSSEKNSDGGSA